MTSSDDTKLTAIRYILEGKAVIFGVKFVRPAEISNPAYETFVGDTQIVGSKKRAGLVMGSTREVGLSNETIDTRPKDDAKQEWERTVQALDPGDWDGLRHR